ATNSAAKKLPLAKPKPCEDRCRSRISSGPITDVDARKNCDSTAVAASMASSTAAALRSRPGTAGACTSGAESDVFTNPVPAALSGSIVPLPSCNACQYTCAAGARAALTHASAARSEEYRALARARVSSLRLRQFHQRLPRCDRLAALVATRDLDHQPLRFDALGRAFSHTRRLDRVAGAHGFQPARLQSAVNGALGF